MVEGCLDDAFNGQVVSCDDVGIAGLDDARCDLVERKENN